MKTLKEDIRFNCSAGELWSILSDIGRCDWVPTIEEITLEGDCRHFEMKGMGQITEKILKQDHSNMMLQVNEEIHFAVRGYYGGGHENPMVRADMIYYKTPNDGAMFAPGSLAWCGSLSHNNYNNNVSRIMENTLKGFLKDGPLP